MEEIKVEGQLGMALRAFLQLTELFGLRDNITYIDQGPIVIRSVGYDEGDYLELRFEFNHYSGPTQTLAAVSICGENAGKKWGPKISTAGRWRRKLRLHYHHHEPENTFVFFPPKEEGTLDFFKSHTDKELQAALMRYFFRDSAAD